MMVSMRSATLQCKSQQDINMQECLFQHNMMAVFSIQIHTGLLWFQCSGVHFDSQTRMMSTCSLDGSNLSTCEPSRRGFCCLQNIAFAIWFESMIDSA